jgi:FlaA1/EpsC-like NDP-sugar epimerase
MVMLHGLDQRVGKMIRKKVILITGAAGTVGTALAKQLLQFQPKVLRLLDQNEEQSFFRGMAYSSDKRVRILLGDVRDRDRMRRALHGVDIVFHCAALKHVGLGEYNPFEVVRTNLVALQSLIEESIDADVERFVFTSSDKAVNPTNVMGGSKFIGERLVAAGNAFKGTRRTVLASTRFGNVLGSSGSVVPIFRQQIRAGGPLKVTHLGMTRFFMSSNESVDLLLACLVAARGGEVFVPKMHAVRLQDFANAMIQLYAPGKHIPVLEIGLRPGEKLYEELISDAEMSRCLETDHMVIVLPHPDEALHDSSCPLTELALRYPDSPRPAQRAYCSQTVSPLGSEGVIALLRKACPDEDGNGK